MDLRGKLKTGTVFIGNVNHIKMEIVEIQCSNLKGCCQQTALVKECATGRIFSYGLQALERCNLTICTVG